MDNLREKLNKLFAIVRPGVKASVQNQENNWVTIVIYMRRDHRVELIECLEQSGEISLPLLAAFSELIRSGELNRDSWADEEREYYQRMFDNAIKFGK